MFFESLVLIRTQVRDILFRPMRLIRVRFGSGEESPGASEEWLTSKTESKTEASMGRLPRKLSKS